METRAFRQHALLPKRPRGARRTKFIPSLPDSDLAELFGRLSPAERHAVRELVENASVEIVDGRAILIAVVSAACLDTLAAFEADAAELENDLEDEPQDVDDDKNSDNALDWTTDGQGVVIINDGDAEPEEPDGPGLFDQAPPDFAGVVPIAEVPSPPPIADHARPAEFDRDPGKVELARDRWSERWKVREIPAERVDAYDETGALALRGRRL